MDKTVDLSNISIYDMPVEDLREKYNTLQKNFIVCQNELETKNQKNYDLHREVSRLGTLEREYLQELDIFQAGESEKITKLQSQILALTKELACCNESHREQIQQLETEKDGEIDKLQSSLQKITFASVTTTVNNAENDKLIQENLNLTEKIEDFEELLTDLNAQLLKVRNYNAELEANLATKVTELENIRETYNCKKEELQECKNLIETQQDQIFTLESELNSVKNIPLDVESRGNSLFAEVDNRRVQLQNNMSVMKTKYVEMKREHNHLLQRISTLEKENTLITKRWEADAADRENGDKKMISALDRRVLVLEDISKKYEESFKPDASGSKQKIMTEIDRLTLELNKESICHSLSRRGLRQCQLELRSCKWTNAELECEVAKLKTQIEILQLNKPNEAIPGTVQPPTAIKSSVHHHMNTKTKPAAKKLDCTSKKNPTSEKPAYKMIDMQTFLNSYPEKKAVIVEKVEKIEKIESEELNDPRNDKENRLPKKVVSFSDDTLEPAMTDRSKYKRARIVVNCPTVYITSKQEPAE